MFAVSLSIDMYETKIINRKKSFKVRWNLQLLTKLFNTIFLTDQANWRGFWLSLVWPKLQQGLQPDDPREVSHRQLPSVRRLRQTVPQQGEDEESQVRFGNLSKVFSSIEFFRLIGCFAPRWLPSPRPRRQKTLPGWSPSVLCTKCCDKSRRKLLEQQQIHSGDSLCQMKL